MKPEQKEPDNIVFIGKKDISNYLMAIQKQSTLYDTVFIKARGMDMIKAINLVEIMKSYQRLALKIDKIETDTEFLQDIETGKPVKVSAIKITLKNDKE